MFDNVNGARLAAKRLGSRYGIPAALARETTARAAGWPDWHRLEKGVGKSGGPHASFAAFVAERVPAATVEEVLVAIMPASTDGGVKNYSYDELLGLIGEKTVRRPDDDILRRNAAVVVMSCGIIDWWQGMVPLRRIDPETLANGDYFEEYDEETGPLTMRTFRTEVYEMLLVARWLAAHTLFEGDITQGPYLSSTPSMDQIDVGATNIIGWKQRNNGSSFIAMDAPMSHLAGPMSGWNSTEYAWLEDGEVRKRDRPPHSWKWEWHGNRAARP